MGPAENLPWHERPTVIFDSAVCRQFVNRCFRNHTGPIRNQSHEWCPVCVSFSLVTKETAFAEVALTESRTSSCAP